MMSTEFWPVFFVVSLIILYVVSIPLLYVYWKDLQRDLALVPKNWKTKRF